MPIRKLKIGKFYTIQKDIAAILRTFHGGVEIRGAITKLQCFKLYRWFENLETHNFYKMISTYNWHIFADNIHGSFMRPLKRPSNGMVCGSADAGGLLTAVFMQLHFRYELECLLVIDRICG